MFYHEIANFLLVSSMTWLVNLKLFSMDPFWYPKLEEKYTVQACDLYTNNVQPWVLIHPFTDSRGGRVVRWSWVNFQCRGVLLVWIRVGQGPTAFAVGAGGGCLDIFTLIYPFSSLSPSLWETTRYRLKYCLKGSLSPKTTNQPATDSHLFILHDGDQKREFCERCTIWIMARTTSNK